MAKIITANKLKRFWQNGVVAKMVAKVRVLSSMEEIDANTNPENIAGATAVAELSNNLNNLCASGDIEGFEVIDGDIYIKYKVGADTVSKKLGNNGYTISGNAIAGTTTQSQTISGMLPLKGIKHLKFSYSFTNYVHSGNITLKGPNGNKTITSVSSGGNGFNQSSTYDNELDKEYDYLIVSMTGEGSGWSGVRIYDVEAK